MKFSQERAERFWFWKRFPMERQVFSIVNAEKVHEKGFSQDVIKPNIDYFTIRLCEMHLKDKRRYFQSYLPMAIMVCEFLYGQGKETIPVFIDNKTLGINTFASDKYVELKNTHAFGPFPFKGGEVSLFTGLFRLDVSNMANNLFNLIGNLANTFDPLGMANYLNIGKVLGQSLVKIFDLDECQFLFGARDAYSTLNNAGNQFRQNYIAYINCSEKKFPIECLEVRDDRLYSGDDPISTHDYCLVKIVASDKRDDYTSFPFYPVWQEAVNHILTGDYSRARYKKVECLQQINLSPDLTEGHKEELLKTFHLDFQKRLSLFQATNDQTTTRGESSNISRRRQDEILENAMIRSSRSLAALSRKQNKSRRVYQSFSELEDVWQDVFTLDHPEWDPRKKEIGDTKEVASIINAKISILKKKGKEGAPDPSNLTDILTMEALEN